MRQIRQTLQLLHEAGLSYAQVARALGMAKATVGKIALLARAAGVDWPLAQTLTDEALEARLYKPPALRERAQQEPDFAWIHQELKRPGVTLALLWEEYARGLAAAGEAAYKYTSFCVKYRAWAKSLKRSMRQVHVAGERLFVDYAGQTVPLIDASTGEISQAQVFVAVLGASNYTFACATATQSAMDWVGAIIRALEFIGGAPRLIVPDQTRALIVRPDRYDPTPNALVEELCAHYGVAVLPARPAHPRDKPKVEVAVQVVERWILARLRNRRFFRLPELDAAIADLLVDLNSRAFRKLPGNRTDAFRALDAPALRALPPQRMLILRRKSASVNIDYHVELEHHYYSVPHQLVGQKVEIRFSDAVVDIFHGSRRVASHAFSRKKGHFTTVAAHMPASHRAHREWTPKKLLDWGGRVGVSCAAVVRWQLEHRPHPEQGYRACLGLRALLRQYGAHRLEAACARALSIRSPRYPSIKSILAAGLDRHSAYEPTEATGAMPAHENVRGPQYYN